MQLSELQLYWLCLILSYHVLAFFCALPFSSSICICYIQFYCSCNCYPKLCPAQTVPFANNALRKHCPVQTLPCANSAPAALCLSRPLFSFSSFQALFSAVPALTCCISQSLSRRRAPLGHPGRSAQGAAAHIPCRSPPSAGPVSAASLHPAPARPTRKATKSADSIQSYNGNETSRRAVCHRADASGCGGRR